MLQLIVRSYFPLRVGALSVYVNAFQKNISKNKTLSFLWVFHITMVASVFWHLFLGERIDSPLCYYS